MISTFDEVVGLFTHTTSRTTELEWPQEIIGFFEILSYGEDFVNEIFDTDYIVLTKTIFNYLVICDWDTLMVHFRITSFIYQFTDAF